MDSQNRESAADVRNSSESAAGTAARMKENFTRGAAERIESTRQTAVGALERTAASVHSGADQISNIGHSTADRIQQTANHIRETDLNNMYSEVERTVRRYPGYSLAVAAACGFVLARLLRRAAD